MVSEHSTRQDTYNHSPSGLIILEKKREEATVVVVQHDPSVAHELVEAILGSDGDLETTRQSCGVESSTQVGGGDLVRSTGQRLERRIEHRRKDRDVLERVSIDEGSVLRRDGRLDKHLQVLVEFEDLETGDARWHQIGSVLGSNRYDTALCLEDTQAILTKVLILTSEREVEREGVDRRLTRAKVHADLSGCSGAEQSQ